LLVIIMLSARLNQILTAAVTADASSPHFDERFVCPNHGLGFIACEISRIVSIENFCRASRSAWKYSPSEANIAAVAP
jgi:hypothetical protein